MINPTRQHSNNGPAAAAILSLAIASSLASAGGFAGYTPPARWSAGNHPFDVQTGDPIGNVRLLNLQTGQFDTVMIHTIGVGGAIHRVLGVDAAPYFDANGVIEMSIRFASAPRFDHNRLEGYVDWVDIAVE